METRTSKLEMCLLAIILISLGVFTAFSSYAQVSEEIRIEDPTEAVNAIAITGGYFDVLVYDPAKLLNPSEVRGFLLCPSREPGTKHEVKLLASWRSDERLTLRFLVANDVPVDDRVSLCGLLIETPNKLVSRDRCVAVFREIPDSLLLMHISDAHLVTPLTPLGTSYHHLLSATFIANALNVDLVVNTGDTADHPGSVDEYSYYLKALRYLRRPILTVPGNHDGAGIPPALYYRVYGRFVGPPYWYRRFGPYLFIGIDTSLGYADLSQLEFVERVLSSNTDAEVKVVMIHYPIFRGGYRGLVSPQDEFSHMYSSWANVPSLAKMFLNLTSRHNLTLVLAGHIHTDGYALYDGKTVFLTTVTLGGSRSYYNGYRIVRIHRNGSIAVVLPPDRSLRDVANSLNIESLYYRQVEFDGGSAIYVKVLRESLAVLPEKFSVYLSSRECGRILVYKVNPSVGIKEAAEDYEIFTATWGERNISIVKVELGTEDAVAGVSIALSCVEKDDVDPPVITDLRLLPGRPRPGIDQVLLEISVEDETAALGGTARVVWYDTGTVPISSSELELVPADTEHRKFSVLVPPSQASYADVVLRIFDAFGNLATETARIEYQKPALTSPSPTPTTTPPTETPVTSPTTTPTTPATTPTTTPVSPIKTQTPTLTTPTTSPEQPPTSTIPSSETKQGLSTLLAIAMGATVLGLIAVILLYKKKS